MITSSGKVSFSDLQNEFGGSNPISMSEYYGTDIGVPASGVLDVNVFHGKSKTFNPSYTTVYSYGVPANAGGRGEGFWRTVASWTNNTSRQGTVRLYGDVGGGDIVLDKAGNPYFSSSTKQFGYQIFVDGVLVQNYAIGYYNNAHPYWDFTTYVTKTSYIYLSCYLWGGYGNDHVSCGNFYVGAV